MIDKWDEGFRAGCEASDKLYKREIKYIVLGCFFAGIGVTVAADLIALFWFLHYVNAGAK